MRSAELVALGVVAAMLVLPVVGLAAAERGSPQPLGGTSPDVSGPTSADAASPEYVAGEILVGFRPGLAPGRVEATRRGLGAAELASFPAIGAARWRRPPGLSVEQAVRSLAGSADVLYAEPNYIVHA